MNDLIQRLRNAGCNYEHWATGTKDPIFFQAADRIEELEAEKSEMEKAINSFTALIEESKGVYGLHLNGDSAPWDSLLAGGFFEDWLLPYSEVLATQEKE